MTGKLALKPTRVTFSKQLLLGKEQEIKIMSFLTLVYKAINITAKIY